MRYAFTPKPFYHIAKETKDQMLNAAWRQVAMQKLCPKSWFKSETDEEISTNLGPMSRLWCWHPAVHSLRWFPSKWCDCVQPCVHTRVSPSGARGSVIQEPNLDPDVLMVMGSLMPVSLPHAARKEARWEHLEQRPFFWVLRLIRNLLKGIHFHLL